MLSFIAALYNEEEEVDDLLKHISPYVDIISIADDGSTDKTHQSLLNWFENDQRFGYQILAHTGLPETVKNEALWGVPEGSWVLMLDADERFAPGVLDQIKVWLTTTESLKYSHVYFRQMEIIDGRPVREFQKSKLFRKEAVKFSTGIHEDDQFTGDGVYKDKWTVLHRKTSDKQKLRESEYLETYKKLLEEGKIDAGRYAWLRGLHHFIR